MELLRWASWAKPDAIACYVGKSILPTGVQAYPEGVDEEISARFARVVTFDSKALRPARLSPKVIGTVLLGAASVFMPLPPEVFPPAMADLVPEGTYDMNVAGFELGRTLSSRSTAEEPAHA